MARIKHVACLRRTTTDELKSSAQPKRANARCSGDARSDPQHDPNCEEREAVLDGCAMQCPRPDLVPRSTIAGRLNETRPEKTATANQAAQFSWWNPGPPHPSPDPAAHVGAGFLHGSRQILLTGNGRGSGLSRLAWDSGSVECHAAWSRAIEVAGPAPTPGRGPPTVSVPVSMTQGSMGSDGLSVEGVAWPAHLLLHAVSRTIFSLVFPVLLWLWT